MGVLSVILYTVAVIIAILLICLVLVQPSKGGGLGSAFGGAGETVFGAQTMNHLSKPEFPFYAHLETFPIVHIA